MGMLEIGDGLKERLQTIRGLRVYATKELPDSVNQFPTALILPGETTYITTLSSNDCDYEFRVILLFSKQDTPSAISKMLPYMAVSGEKSVVAAVHSGRTLGGNVDDCRVVSNLGIASLVWGNVAYLSTEFSVQIWAE